MSTTTTWTAGNGNFSTAADWSAGIPGAGVDAFIYGAEGTPLTISYSAGSDTIDSLTTSYAGIAMSGGALTLSNVSNLSQTAPGAAALNLRGGGLTFLNFENSGNTSTISGQVVQGAAGKITIATGALQLYGSTGAVSSLAGSLVGGGEILLSGGTTYDLATTAVVTVGTLALTANDTLVTTGAIAFGTHLYLDGESTLSLGSNNFTIGTGGSGDLRGTLSGTGTFLAQGAVSLNQAPVGLAQFYFTLAGSEVYDDIGTTTVNGSIVLGDTAASTALLAVKAGAVFNLYDGEISANGGASILSAGTIESISANSGGANTIYAPVISTGTVSVTQAQGFIVFAGGGTFSGLLSGAGSIILGGASSFAISAGTSLSVANLAIDQNGIDQPSSVSLLGSETYTGNFYLDGGCTLDTNANVFALSSATTASLRGDVTGTGTFVAKSAVSLNDTARYPTGYNFTIGGDEKFEVSTSATQVSEIYVGDSATSTATLQIDAGAVYDDLGNLIAGQGASVIINNGTLENTAGGTGDGIYDTVISAGTITAVSGASVQLEGGGTLSGTIGGAGEVDFGNAGTYKIAAGTTLSAARIGIYPIYHGAGTTVDLLGSFSYSGSLHLDASSDLNLGSNNFTLAAAGIADAGSDISGTGTFLNLGTLTLDGGGVAGGAVLLDDKGAAILSGNATVGDSSTSSAEFLVDAGGSLDLRGSGLYQGGAGHLVVKGSLENTVVNTTGTVFVTVSSTGTVLAAASAGIAFEAGGTIGGTVRGGGTVSFGNASTTTIAAATNITAAGFDVGGFNTTLTLAGSLSYAGDFYLDGPSTLNIGSNGFTLATGSTADLRGLISGTGLVQLHGTASLNDTFYSYGQQEFTVGSGATIQIDDTASMRNAINIGNGGTAEATLDITSGHALDIAGDYGIGASGPAMLINAGSLQKTGGGSGSYSGIGAFISSTGTILVEVANNQLYFSGGGAISGALAGAGEISLQGGTTYTLGAGISLGVAGININNFNTTVLLGGSESFAGSLYLDGNSVLSLGGHTLTLAAASSADMRGTLTGGGTLVSSGTLSLNDTFNDYGQQYFTVGGGTTLDIAGGAQTLNTIFLGNSSTSEAVLQIAGTGTLNVEGTAVDTGGSAALQNAGLLENTSTGAATINAAVTSTGTVETAGTISFNGGGSFDGTLAGAGTLDFGGGTATIAAGASVSVGAIGIYSAAVTLGGTLTYGGSLYEDGYGTLSLASGTSTLTAASTATLSGLVNGSATLLDAGALQVNDTFHNYGQQEFTLGGAATLEISGTATVLNAVILGDSATSTAKLKLVAGGTLDIAGDNGIGANGNATLVSAGLIEKTAGGADASSTIAAVVESTGTIENTVATNALVFSGGGSLGGTVSGSGTIDLSGGRQYTIASRAHLSVAALNIEGNSTQVTASTTSYGGHFALAGGDTLTVLSGANFSLTGSATLQGTVNGAGTISASGSSAQLLTNGLLLGGSAVLADTKAVMAQDAQWTIGDTAASTASLAVAAGSIYEITADVGIGSEGLGGISNAGTFEKLSTTGTSVISPEVSNSGTLLAGSGTLDFTTQFSNTGTAEANLGALDFGAATVNDATILATRGSAITFGAAVVADSGKAGTIALSDGGLAKFGGYVSSSQTLSFLDGSTNTADISTPGIFSALIEGFSGSNLLDFAGITNVTGSYVAGTGGGVLTLTEEVGGSAVTEAQLHFSGSFSLSSFYIGNDGTGGTIVELASAHAG